MLEEYRESWRYMLWINTSWLNFEWSFCLDVRDSLDFPLYRLFVFLVYFSMVSPLKADKIGTRRLECLRWISIQTAKYSGQRKRFNLLLLSLILTTVRIGMARASTVWVLVYYFSTINYLLYHPRWGQSHYE